MTGPISKAELFACLPPPWPGELRSQIRTLLSLKPSHKLVVLDDDPTGTQTVYDVPVLTGWDVGVLARELKAPGSCFYVLTNSRSLPPERAGEVIRQLARNLREAVWRNAGCEEEPPHARQLCCDAFTLVSRSDSTLRGHFPLETDILAEELGPFDATILIPYFDDGGRYTVGDVHYVAERDQLVPAAETAFARDVTFGYRHSNLRDWIEEKTGGRVRASDVVSFTIEELRTASERHEPSRNVFVKLRFLEPGCMAVVNACAPADMEFFACASLWAERAGGRCLYRTAAQFVAARLGLEPRPLWVPSVEPAKADAANSLPSRTGGLIIVGSHVPKTTEQLARLVQSGEVEHQSVDVERLLDEGKREPAIAQTVSWLEESLRRGRDTVISTSRALVTGADGTSSLAISNRVSAALVEIIRRLAVRPGYLLAKGGITSCDIATQALGVRRAIVLGQLLPGVPVWQLGSETRFPGLPYVVFPGNVGGPDALGEAVSRLAERR